MTKAMTDDDDDDDDDMEEVVRTLLYTLYTPLIYPVYTLPAAPALTGVLSSSGAACRNSPYRQQEILCFGWLHHKSESCR